MTARRAVTMPRAGKEGGGSGAGWQLGCVALEWEGAGDCLLEFLLQTVVLQTIADCCCFLRIIMSCLRLLRLLLCVRDCLLVWLWACGRIQRGFENALSG